MEQRQVRRAATVWATAALIATGGPVAAGETTIMTGLDNPRGMAIAPNGALYVTEAGRGAPPGPGVRCEYNGAGELRCLGLTGAVTRYWKEQQERIVEGLPSLGVYGHKILPPALVPPGSSANGANGISFQGTGGAFVTLGLGGGPAYEDAFGNPFLGTLIQLSAGGKWKVVGDLAQYEFDRNPDGGNPDSNPYGVLAEPGRRIVADAGANAIVAALPSGRVETVAVLPPPALGVEPVPTSVVRGPDGALYVGQLTGLPFPAGGASVYRIVEGKPPEVFCSGFTAIIGLAFGPDGNLYVVEHASGGPPFLPPGSGKLSKIAAPLPATPSDCKPTSVREGLNHPTAVAVADDGTVFVTNNGRLAGQGQVIAISP